MQQLRHFFARKTVGIKLAMTEGSSLGHKRILLQAYSSPVLVEKAAVMFFKIRQIERGNFLKSSASQF